MTHEVHILRLQNIRPLVMRSGWRNAIRIDLFVYPLLQHYLFSCVNAHPIHLFLKRDRLSLNGRLFHVMVRWDRDR